MQHICGAESGPIVGDTLAGRGNTLGSYETAYKSGEHIRSAYTTPQDAMRTLQPDKINCGDVHFRRSPGQCNIQASVPGIVPSQGWGRAERSGAAPKTLATNFSRVCPTADFNPKLYLSDKLTKYGDRLAYILRQTDTS